MQHLDAHSMRARSNLIFCNIMVREIYWSFKCINGTVLVYNKNTEDNVIYEHRFSFSWFCFKNRSSAMRSTHNNTHAGATDMNPLCLAQAFEWNLHLYAPNSVLHLKINIFCTR